MQLDVLISKINTAHRAACGDAIEALGHAAECGRHLSTAKAAVGHGKWVPWVEANTNVGAQQAAKYMRLANRWAEIEAKANISSKGYLTIDGALKMIAKPRKAHKHKYPPTVEALAGKMHAAGQTRAEVAEAMGVSERVVQSAKQHAIGYDEGFADGAASTAPLSKSAEQKVSAAVRYRLRALEAELEARLAVEKQTWIDRYKTVLDDAYALQQGRRGIITKQEALDITKSLHPDNSAGEKTRNKAFITWERIKHVLMDERDDPTVIEFPGKRTA